MITGLYRHYKGGLYIALCRTWESDNDAQRVRRVVYLSLQDFKLDDRTESEFLSTVLPAVCTIVCYDIKERGALQRFKRILPPWQPRRS